MLKIVEYLSSQGIPEEHHEGLKEQANRLMARRSLPGLYMYTVCVLLVSLTGGYLAAHLRMVLSFMGFTLAIGTARLFLHSRFDAMHRSGRRRSWETGFAIGSLTAAAIWSVFAVWTIHWYGLTPPTYVALLFTTTIVAMGIVVFARNLWFSTPYVAIMLLPQITVLFLGPEREGLGIGLALSIYVIYTAVFGRQLHGELWQRLAQEKGADLQADEVRQARDLAEAGNRAKSEFLANMSHEIRTPMVGILGLSEILLQSELGAVQRDQVDTIYHSGESLLRLIDDILDMSRIEAGKLSIKSMVFRLADSFDWVQNLLAPRAEAKGLRLRFDVRHSRELRLRGDPLRLRQILVNLVGNAIKFSAGGEVVVQSELQQRREEGTWLRIAVHDSGIGIDPEVLPSLFAPFTQADSSTQKEYGGTGLGLAICKRIVDQMGGDIGVASAPKEGSTFWFRLPFEDAGDAPPEETTELDLSCEVLPISRRDRQGLRILLVEDNPVNRLVIEQQVAELGYQIQACDSGVEAIRLLGNEPFDLVLMDCQMPGWDGYETTRRMRKLGGAAAQLPVISLTAHAGPEVRRRALEAEMNDFLAKPYRSEELARLLDHWLQDASAATGPTSLPMASADAIYGSDDILDPRPLQALQAVNEPQDGHRSGDLVSEIVTTYLNDSPRQLANLRGAYEAGDLPEVSRVAHYLKGSSATLGATRFAALCDEIELGIEDLEKSALASRIERLGDELRQATEALKQLLDTGTVPNASRGS